MSRTLAHRFDREGRDVELTFPDGHKFWSRRDGLGRMVESYHGPLGDPATGMAGFHYDAAAQLHRIGRWGSATNLGYDPAGRLSMLEHGFASGPGHTVSTFAYNPAGQLSSETRTNDSYAWTGSAAVSRPYTVNGQNQYLAAGPASFDYDPNGNLTSDGTMSFVYDVENRLVSASARRSGRGRAGMAGSARRPATGIAHRPMGPGQYCGRPRSLVGVAATVESRPGRES